jgi:hypothetical protein
LDVCNTRYGIQILIRNKGTYISKNTSYRIASRFYTTSACGGIQRKEFPVQSSYWENEMAHKKQLYLVALVIYISMSYSIFLFAEEKNILFLIQEDGFYETLTAIFFLAASFFFLINFWKEKKGNNIFIVKTRKNYFYLLLCIIFFFGKGYLI